MQKDLRFLVAGASLAAFLSFWAGCNPGAGALGNAAPPATQPELPIVRTVHGTLINDRGQGMYSGFCAVCGGSALEDWKPCGRCHVGGADVAFAPPEADCAVCHSGQYDFSKRRFDEATQRWDYSDAGPTSFSLLRPTAQACLRCHDTNMRDKRGTPYAPDEDVHAAQGIDCIACHVPQQDHLIPAGRYVADLAANDLPDVEVTCQACHESHVGSPVDRVLSGPHGKLDCTCCHIASTGGIVYCDYEAIDSNGEPYIERQSNVLPYEVVTFNRGAETNTVFVYRWWDGRRDSQGKAVFAKSPDSRLWPIKLLRTTMRDGTRMEGALQLSHATGRASSDTCRRCHESDAGMVDTGTSPCAAGQGEDCLPCHDATGL